MNFVRFQIPETTNKGKIIFVRSQIPETTNKGYPGQDGVPTVMEYSFVIESDDCAGNGYDYFVSGSKGKSDVLLSRKHLRHQ